MRSDKDNLIVKLTFEFALKIIAYSEQIRQLNRFEMASQIFKSGTSIGANINEAQNAESKADFVHKLRFQQKKAMNYIIGCNFAKNQSFTRIQVKNFLKNCIL